MGMTSLIYNTFMKTNVRFGLTIIAGGLIFEQFFDRTTRHVFRNIINQGVSIFSWMYLGATVYLTQVLMMQILMINSMACGITSFYLEIT